MKTYTTQEAAELTGSSVRALRKRIERGQLRAVQQGHYWRIPHTELAELFGVARSTVYRARKRAAGAQTAA